MLILLAMVIFAFGGGLGTPHHNKAEARMQTAAVWETEVRRKRHYYRRHGETWRRYDRVEPQQPPVRPLSCGEFRFWDGTSCVDVRFR